MNYSTYNISLDIHDTASQVSLNVKKGDTLRRICAVLTENGKPYKIAEGVRAVFRAKKPADSNGYRAIVFNDAQIIDNKVCYIMVSENTEIAGIADCELTLYGTNGGVITSPKFTLIIDNTVNEDDEVEEIGSNELTALSALMTETANVKHEVETKLANGEFVGEQGKQGATYTPSVSADGVISWANDKGLDNPQPVNIKGIQGEKGEKGDQGIQGVQGVQGVRGNQGEKGDKGDTGRDGYTPIKGVDYYTEADKQEFRNELSAEHKQFANAIKGTAYGNTVVIDDVSPCEHTAKVNVHGKNLIPYPYANTTKEMYGITFTDNGDGSITINGTATNAAYFILQKDAEYGGTINAMAVESATNGAYVASSRLYYNSINKMLTVNINTGATITNETIYPQLEKGTTLSAYEPYLDPTTVTLTVQTESGESVATYTPNVDGICEVVSASPTITISTDKANAIIECEYNRDANKVIAELLGIIAQSVSLVTYIDLPSSGWQGTANLYSQVVSINGATENSKVDINPSVEQLAVFHEKDIAFVAENEDGVVTVYCIGQKPADDYTMQVTITEVITNG